MGFKQFTKQLVSTLVENVPVDADLPLDHRLGDYGDVATLYDGAASRTYLTKLQLVATAINESGFGRYQWGLFFVAGFGWMADNIWPVVTGLILARLNEIDGVHPPAAKLAPYLTLAQNLGLLVGALFWLLLLDLIGRKWAFSLTFLITGIAALIAGGMPTFTLLLVFVSLWSFGVGGNLPVDLALFLEALPQLHRWLLTVMLLWWALGQIIANLVAWGLLGKYSCDTKSICFHSDNQGWRYFLFTMGGMTLVMFVARFLFKVLELPYFYLAKGNNVKAAAVVERIANSNGYESTLSVEDLEAVDQMKFEGLGEPVVASRNLLLREKIAKYNFSHLRACFKTRKLAYSSTLVILLWGIVGLAFPLYNAFLPYYLESRGNANAPLSVHQTYRNTLVVATMGIPGALFGGILVELRTGRRGALCMSLVSTGIFLLCSTTAKTSAANLGWNCAFSFVSSAMYGVLYAYTPEIFVLSVRGTGVGLASSFNRVMGIFAPIIAIYADLTTSVPIFVSGALFLAAGLLTILLPYESRHLPSL